MGIVVLILDHRLERVSLRYTVPISDTPDTSGVGAERRPGVSPLVTKKKNEEEKNGYYWHPVIKRDN